MRRGGREIESVAATTPGTLEFIPNQPAQHHRMLDGNDMLIAYGPQNRIESFHANDVSTHTDPTAEERKRKRVPSITTEPRNAGALRPQDQPHGANRAERRFHLRGRRPQGAGGQGHRSTAAPM